ncbi:MAG: TetR/AcrR family transcriptional regulator [Clostridiales bacterium]|nr:TetR/AcrR family transcriptional regulator [Clostridiales bacterium]
MSVNSNASDKNRKIVNNDKKLSGLKKHSEELNRLVVESLQGALLKLIEIKPYDEISITELCNKAGVSRTSFYGNFDSKDDILRRIVVELQKEIVSRIGSPFRRPIGIEWYIALFNLVKEHANILKPIFGAGFQNKYLELVNSVILRHRNMQPAEVYLRLIFAGGIVNTIAYWLASDMAEPVDKMAEYCKQYLTSFNEKTCIK